MTFNKIVCLVSLLCGTMQGSMVASNRQPSSGNFGKTYYGCVWNLIHNKNWATESRKENDGTTLGEHLEQYHQSDSEKDPTFISQGGDYCLFKTQFLNGKAKEGINAALESIRTSPQGSRKFSKTITNAGSIRIDVKLPEALKDYEIYDPYVKEQLNKEEIGWDYYGNMVLKKDTLDKVMKRRKISWKCGSLDRIAFILKPEETGYSVCSLFPLPSTSDVREYPTYGINEQDNGNLVAINTIKSENFAQNFPGLEALK